MFHKLLTIGWGTGQQFYVDVDEPSLVRINRCMLAGVTVFAPTVGGAISLAAWPDEETPPGTNTLRRFSRAWRGSGPMIYLPTAGRWNVCVEQSRYVIGQTSLTSQFDTFELSVIALPPDIAAAYIASGPPASYHVSGAFTVPAATAINLFAVGALDLSLGSPENAGPGYWHSLVSLAVQSNETPAADQFLVLGRDPDALATAGTGALLGGASRRVFTWQEIAGQTVFLNNLSGANAYDICVEAHFY